MNAWERECDPELGREERRNEREKVKSRENISEKKLWEKRETKWGTAREEIKRGMRGERRLALRVK